MASANGNLVGGSHDISRKESLDDDEVAQLTQSDFVGPEYEFDSNGIELTATHELESFEDDELPQQYVSGRMTPEGFIDEDFESELACCADQETTVQETLDAEYRDISHLGIIQVAGDDRLGRKVIVFAACRLPRVEDVNHQRLYEYIKKTLEQYVANDYSLVYLHYGLSSHNKPSVKWLFQAYRGFDRNFKKNLKALYLVHPTQFTLFMLRVFRPIISAKFGQKISFIYSLKELVPFMYLEQMPIPDLVKRYDASLPDDRRVGTPHHWHHNSQNPADPRFATVRLNLDQKPPTQLFNVSLEFIKINHHGNVLAPVLVDSIEYIRSKGMDVEGIFRRSPNSMLVKSVQQRYNLGQLTNFDQLGDPHLPAVLIKTFLRELTEPILTFNLFDQALLTHTMNPKNKLDIARNMISEQLPMDNYVVLKYLMAFLSEVAAHSNTNRMTDVNLGLVFGPNLIWPRDVRMMSITTASQLNAFTQLLIAEYDAIFVK